MSNFGRLAGKIAVTCGTTQGIGLEVARRFAKEGAKVIISSRKQENVDEATDLLRKEGLNVTGLVCHVANSEQRLKLFEEAKKLGGLDILYINAGVNPAITKILNCSESAWDKAFEVNVKAPFLLTKEAVPLLKQSKAGRVIYMSTVSLWAYRDELGVYSVSKTALAGLTKMVARQLAEDNITVNSVAPGLIDTKFGQILVKKIDEIIPLVPLKRLGTVEEVAGLVTYLASEEAAYLTGEIIPITGGITTRI